MRKPDPIFNAVESFFVDHLKATRRTDRLKVDDQVSSKGPRLYRRKSTVALNIPVIDVREISDIYAQYT